MVLEKRGKQFLFARSIEIIMKRLTIREKFSFLKESEF